MANASFPTGLYFVSTPIGAARDITLRALDILTNADVIAAEDTRVARRLMDIHAIALNGRPLMAYHDHNGAVQRPKIIAAIKDGARVAYVSDAGTPLLADPGFLLSKAAIDAGFEVFAAPGASALLAALAVSGLPTDQFFFAGFLPNKQIARKRALEGFANLEATLIFYESPKRVQASLAAMIEVFGGTRQAVFCRELTKKFESHYRGSLEELAAMEIPQKGEFVLLLGPPERREVSDGDLQIEVIQLLTEMSVKEASKQLAEEFNIPRNRVYEIALKVKGQK